MRPIILFLLVLTLPAASCKKKDNTGSSANYWSGNWSWVMSRGGIAGLTETPASTGRHLNYNFIDDKKLVITDNSNVTNTTYRVDKKTSANSGALSDILTIDNVSIESVLTHYSDTMVISEDVVDGFSYFFVKVK